MMTMMMIMMITMGHDVKGGQCGGEKSIDGGRGKEEQATLHMYVQRQHNETHQILYKRVEGRRGMGI
jgi:hypothetical protein